MADYLFQASVTLTDSKQLKSTLNFRRVIDDLTPEAAFATANAEWGDLITDLKAVTDAAVTRSAVTFLDVAPLEAIPAEGVADISDEGVVMCWLSDVGQLDKYAALRIPAPIDMFESDQKTLDKTNAQVIAYVANFGPAKWEVSDGENVVVSRDDGIQGGHWRSRAKSTA